MNRALVRFATALLWSAAVAFALGAVAVVAFGSSWAVAAMTIAAALWALTVRARERARIDSAYGLMARIGEGEFAARADPGDDELALRLHRGVARVQRGFSEALAHAETERDELRSLLGAVDTGLIAFDDQLRIKSANAVAERLLDLPTGGYRRKILGEVVRQAELLAFMERARSARGTMTAEIPLSGGGVERILVAAEPVHAPSGQLTAIFVAFDDMTRVRRLEQLRTDFAANVSHELRTPITNIKGYLETLFQVGFDDPAQSRQFLEIIQRNTNRLCALVEDILLLAFLERPGAERQVAFSRASVRAVVQDALDQLEPAAKAKSMPLQVDVDPSLVVLVDAALVTQAVLNLASNAVKYAPEGTPITVSATLADSTVAITVADKGPGIDPIHVPRLFERFYRIESARSRELGGTGLGLAIVKHIALLHGGAATLECPPGGGARFSLSIPRGSREECAP